MTVEIKSKITSYKVVGNNGVEIEEEVIIPGEVSLPDDAPARMVVLKSEGKKWYVTVVFLPDSEKPFALFAHTNAREKSVTTSNAVCVLNDLAKRKGISEEHIVSTKTKCEQENNVGKLTRTLSLLLRHGVTLKSIVLALEKVEDMTPGSFLFRIKKFLSSYIKDGEKVETESCSDCGGSLLFSGGCMTCSSCGNSKCS